MSTKGAGAGVGEYSMFFCKSSFCSSVPVPSQIPKLLWNWGLNLGKVEKNFFFDGLCPLRGSAKIQKSIGES